MIYLKTFYWKIKTFHFLSFFYFCKILSTKFKFIKNRVNASVTFYTMYTFYLKHNSNAHNSLCVITFSIRLTAELVQNGIYIILFI